MSETTSDWVTVWRWRQIDGSMRLLQVPRSYADEVRRVLREDSVRAERLWCPYRTVDRVGRT